MSLTAIDWAVIIGYLLVNLAIGIYYRRRASGNTEEFFVSGRDVSWWLAGTSMVATTFAADTPLFVCGVVARQGIAGNWIWWSFCVGGMLTVFFFARYWRRAEILTDVQFCEIRYGGKPAAFLRGFKAVYLGLFMNCFILGWVTRAMVNIIASGRSSLRDECYNSVDFIGRLASLITRRLRSASLCSFRLPGSTRS